MVRHDPDRWQEFRRRYHSEIREHRDLLGRLRTLAQHGSITLVFAAHDEADNDAVLKDLLRPHVDDRGESAMLSQGVRVAVNGHGRERERERMTVWHRVTGISTLERLRRRRPRRALVQRGR